MSHYLRILMRAKPQSFRDFYLGVIKFEPPGEALKDEWMTHVERHGIVYLRARFQDTTHPFVESAPSDLDLGVANAARIRGIWFVRGDVSARLVKMRAVELRALHEDEIDRVRLLFKAAVNGAGERAQPFTIWTAASSEKARQFSGENFFRAIFPTVEAGLPDGPYDLVAQGFSTINKLHWDSLLPDFTGDSNLALDNTDERWLKRIGTWFSHGGVRTSDAAGDAAGRVNVDNTPPRIVPASIFPPPNAP